MAVRCECRCVEASIAPDQQYWLLQPLLDAGVGLDLIRVLLFRLGFEDVVAEGRGTVAGLHAVVADQPAEVRMAWAQMIGRMLALPAMAGGRGD